MDYKSGHRHIRFAGPGPAGTILQVQWRLARAHVFVGDVSKGEEKKQAYLTAERYAQ